MPINRSHLAYHDPQPARGCKCEAPFGDPREGTCAICGHQVNGTPMSGGLAMFPNLIRTQEPKVRKRPRYGGAP